ncbi:hypothetical protein [Candidatus Cardinium hertigii]|uniref:F-box domain-containing protein n=1 Tax=Candidatus Cardinium hertigii TaxID=247481 RepID=A0A3N2QCA2_9BACT|nr:hypothetical protein [Candidatus Cardinium hertigii]ROT47415.1 hypothetical protein EDM02_03205 [Candidatus Cardinium hertigii]
MNNYFSDIAGLLILSGTIAACQSTANKHNMGLNNLPTEIQQKVYNHLHKQDALMMRQVNKTNASCIDGIMSNYFSRENPFIVHINPSNNSLDIAGTPHAAHLTATFEQLLTFLQYTGISHIWYIGDRYGQDVNRLLELPFLKSLHIGHACKSKSKPNTDTPAGGEVLSVDPQLDRLSLLSLEENLAELPTSSTSRVYESWNAPKSRSKESSAMCAHANDNQEMAIEHVQSIADALRTHPSLEVISFSMHIGNEGIKLLETTCNHNQKVEINLADGQTISKHMLEIEERFQIELKEIIQRSLKGDQSDEDREWEYHSHHIVTTSFNW